MQELISIILPVFIILITGYLIRLMHIIDSTFISSINKSLYNFFLPLLLFYEIEKADYTKLPSMEIICITLLSICIIFGLSLLLSKLLHINRCEAFSIAMNCFRGNYAYMGLPVSYFFYGTEGITIAAIFMAFIVPFVNILSVTALALGSTDKGDLKKMFVIAIFNPIVIGCAAGFTCLVLAISLPETVDKSINILSNVTMPLALICIGGGINISLIKGNVVSIILVLFFKLFVLPAVALTLLFLYKVDFNKYIEVLIIMLASPCATVNYILAVSLGGSTILTTAVIILTTLLSIFVYPLWYSIVNSFI
jgi:predicted permease